MKYIILRTLIISFLISGFSKVFSQEEKLEIYFDINEDGSAESYSGKILVEYNIKNEKDEIIGRVILDPGMDEFQYFNIKNEIVAYRWNFDKNNSSPFDNKTTKFSVRDKKSVGLIFKQEWNSEKDRFDIFSTGDKLIGNISLNLKTGLWELYRIENKYYPEKRIFSNYFEINSTNARNKKPSQRRTISGRVTDYGGEPLPGAVVQITGTSRFVTTDFDGNYSIEASTGDVLVISFKGFRTTKKTILFNTTSLFSAKLISKSKLSNKKSNKKWKAKDVYGFGVNISLNHSGLKPILDGEIKMSDRIIPVNEKIRFGAEVHDIFGDYNSLGITFGIKKSDTFVSDEYNLSDYDLALTYGFSFLYNLLKFKVGLGYYTYNFNTTESFGDFYDYGGGVYYSAGLQLYIPLGNSGMTLDGFYNNDGLGYGVGFKF